jgi:hypothetical protein
MGRIIGVQRRQKASAAVGTPGLDFSSARAFNALAAGTLTIARRLEQRQQITNSIDSTKEAQLISDDANKFVSKIKERAEQGLIDPTQALKEIKATRRKVAESHISNLENKKLKNLVTSKNQTLSIRHINRDAKWAENLQIVNAKRNLDTVDNNLAYEAGTLTNIDEFRDLVQTDYVKLNQDARASLSAGNAALKEEEALKNGLISYLDSRIINDPDLADEEFNDGKNQLELFGKVFSSTEISRYRKKIVAAKEGLNLETRVRANTEISSFIKAITSKENPTIADYEQLKLRLDERGKLTSPRRFRIDNIITNMLKNTKVDEKVEKDQHAYSDLEVRFRQTEDPTKGKDALEENNDLVVDIEDEYMAGNITKSERDGLVIPLQDAVEAVTRSEEPPVVGPAGELREFEEGKTLSYLNYFIRRAKDPTITGLSKIDSYLAPLDFRNEKQKLDIRGKLIRDLHEANSRDRKNKIKVTDETIQKNIDKILEDAPIRYRMPPKIAEDSDLSYLSPDTGRIYSFINGSYQLIG